MGHPGRPKRPFNADAAEEYAGKDGLLGLGFTKKPKPKKKPPGRPPKKKRTTRSSTRGAPADERVTPSPARQLKTPPEQLAAAVDAADVPAAPSTKSGRDDDGEAAPPPAATKKGRINWGKEPHRSRMEKAISDWINKEGDAIDENGEEITDYVVYANRIGINHNSLYRYIHPDPDKRLTLGDGSRGKKKSLSDHDVKFAGAVLARADRGNDGLGRKEGVDLVQGLNPELTRESARKQLSRRIVPENVGAGVLKSKTVKVQATTSDRTNINVAQQFRWHRLVDEVYGMLREKNTGLCKKSKKLFGDVMEHFIIGLDEMCLMSNMHGDLQVFGAADKKKHEKLLDDSRVSITVVRTGTVAGTTGPTIFLLKGKKKKKSYTDEFLERHGMAPGSTIVMTENAYMTDEAWLPVMKAIVKGYRQLPFVSENEDWLVAELLDGFKSHENVLAAHKLRSESNIVSVKEESNSSHANQGYDQMTAKMDKKNAAESLYDQRKIMKWKTGKTNISQYDLVLTAMRIVRACKPETWVSSFRRVNLDPRTRVPFHGWCEKISPFLMAGEAFKEEDVDPSPQQKFNLLPSFWHGMMAADRKVVMTVMQSHGFHYTVDCLQQLRNECFLPLSQMDDLKVCVIISREHPETLDFECTRDAPSAAGENEAELAAARAEMATQTDGLDDFQLFPKDATGNVKLQGEELFQHMCRFRNMHSAADSKDGEVARLEPTKGLNVELEKDSLECIQPKPKELRRGAVLRDTFGDRAQRKCAQRKLNNIGSVVGHCAILNSDENMERMQDNLEFAASVAEMERANSKGKAEKEKQADKDHEAKAPGAAMKLETKGRDIAGITQKEIEALLYKVYNKTMTGSKLRKNDYVNALRKEFERNVGKYEEFLRSLEPAESNSESNNGDAGVEE